MLRNYRVYVKATIKSPWRDTGIVESDKATARTVWDEIIRKSRHHAFKLEPIVYGTPIDRSSGNV